MRDGCGACVRSSKLSRDENARHADGKHVLGASNDFAVRIWSLKSQVIPVSSVAGGAACVACEGCWRVCRGQRALPDFRGTVPARAPRVDWPPEQDLLRGILARLDACFLRGCAPPLHLPCK